MILQEHEHRVQSVVLSLTIHVTVSLKTLTLSNTIVPCISKTNPERKPPPSYGLSDDHVPSSSTRLSLKYTRSALSFLDLRELFSFNQYVTITYVVPNE